MLHFQIFINQKRVFSFYSSLSHKLYLNQGTMIAMHFEQEKMKIISSDCGSTETHLSLHLK